MLIEQIKFIETTQFDYQINFIYKGNNLQTPNIPRSATAEEVVAIIKPMLIEFDAKRAQTNFDLLRQTFEGQSVDI